MVNVEEKNIMFAVILSTHKTPEMLIPDTCWHTQILGNQIPNGTSKNTKEALQSYKLVILLTFRVGILAAMISINIPKLSMEKWPEQINFYQETLIF